jgi:predicted ATPase
LHPLVEGLERAAGFERDDPPEARLAKLETLLARGTNKLDRAVPLIAALLGIPTDERYPALDLTPQRQKELTLEALLDQLAGLAAEQPLMVVHEDVQWIDPTTEELLSLAIERTQRLPVLMIISFRPEFVPPWPGQPHVSEVALTRLDRREGAAMVDRVIGAKPWPAEVTTQIVAKTDGVPLFVEELIKAVLESGLLADAGDHYELSGPLPPLAIPATLHDSLLARLDRLATVKEVAQIGAAIGREFSYALLAAVTDRPEDQLHDALDQLVSSELVFRHGTPPEASYSFKHALVQDAAYATLLKSRRQHLHARIAHVLEEQFPEIAESQPALLAHHSTEAGLTAQAINYRRRAARLAVARSAHLEAIAEATKGLETLAGLPDGPERRRQELDLQLALGRALIAAKGHGAPETGRSYARARELHEQLGDAQLLFPVLHGRHLVHFGRGELELAEEFLRLARCRNDTVVRARGHGLIGDTSLRLGRLIVARAHLEDALALDDPAERRPLTLSQYPYDSRIVNLAALASALLLLGYPDQALSCCRQALVEAQDLGHPESLAYAMSSAAGLAQDLRDMDAARQWAEAVIALATERGLPHFLAEGTLFRAWALAGREELEEVIGGMRQGVSAMRAGGTGFGIPCHLLSLAGVYGKAGHAAQGLELIAEALSCVETTGECWFEAELHRVRGKLLLALPEPDQPEAEACFRQALAVAREQDARMWELRAAASLARLWRDQGRRAQARDLLAPVYGWFTQGFETADLKDAKALLDELA